MKGFEETLVTTIRVVCTGLLAALFVLLLGQVIVRYFSLPAITWTDEIIEALFAWLTFLGAAALVRERGHLQVGFLDWLLGGRGAGVVEGLRVLASVAFMVVMAVSGALLVRESQARLSPILHLPYAWWYLSIPVSAGLMLFFVVRRLGKKR